MKHIASALHPSHSFYSLVWGLIFGIVLSLSLNLLICRTPLWLFLIIPLVLIPIFFPRLETLPLAFAAGLLLGNLRAAPILSARALLSSLVGQTITLSGTLADDPASGATHLKDPVIKSPVSTPLSGTFYIKLSQTPEALARSDHIELSGTLSSAFGTFAGSLYRPEIRALSKPSPGDLANEFKHFFASRIREYLPSPEADLGLGYLMGEKSGLPEELSDALRAVGMTHVVVASGAHLAIIVSLVKKLFGRISRFASLIFSLLIILAFALVVGFTPSMTRAALVASLSLLVGYVGRQFTPLRLIAFVAALTLLPVPENFLNLGWQLSFASFFGILIVSPLLTKLLYGGKTPPWLASMLLTGISTTLVCSPILIYSFGTLSVLSLVANLIILPTLPYAMLFVLLTGTASFFAPLAALFSFLARTLLDLHLWLVNFLSEKTIFILNLPSADPRIFLLYLPLGIFLIICYNRINNSKQSTDNHASDQAPLTENQANDQEPSINPRNAHPPLGI